LDLNVNAYRIVSSLTNENKEESGRSQASRAAGKRGGPARAAALTRERRKEIAAQASRARWANRVG
jgi:hypothetical protein